MGGVLDLGGCSVTGSIALVQSHFEELFFAQDARINGLLALEGSHLGEGLMADGLQVNSDIVLRNGFVAKGEVRLLGAQIGGNLSCSGGRFEVLAGDALSADGAAVRGSVFLNEGFRTTGEVRLLGAQIGGNLECRGGRFEVLEGDALSADGAVVKGAVFLQDIHPAARFNFSHADVGVLVDDVAAWAPGSVFDGFRYGAIGGTAPARGAERLEWLSRQPAAHMGKEDFRPQPWRQLQRVLSEMGHKEDARQVGMFYERQLRRAGRVGQSPRDSTQVVSFLKRQAAEALHWAYGFFYGYGYRPERLLMSLLPAVWLICGALFWFLALPPRNALAPSNPLVFQHPAYAECLPDAKSTPGNWFLCAPLRGEYATLSPFVYSLDILLPLVDLGQEKHWGAYVVTPKAGAGEELLIHWTWGHAARLLIWFETLFGWVCSLLLVAIVSGFARRSDEG
ncbi:hypothetical protein [Inhella sp.]|uniref:hypothetical protein n=1 Tax=Inhella sp. TaxID=1921806 RepID=UPI0035AE3B3A